MAPVPPSSKDASKQEASGMHNSKTRAGMSSIVPHSKVQGVDICATMGYHYIIRSDTGVFMKSDNLNKGSDIHVHDLHYSCQGGNHYLATNGYFYIIRGTDYRRVTNLNTDADSVTYSLHPNCQGGDHYLSMCGKFYIIFKDRGIYRRTTNMNKDDSAVEYKLHPSCKDGLYYWGDLDYAYFVKPSGEWGPQYHQTSNMNHDLHNSDYSFSRDVVNFLPGGLGITKGSAFGKWKIVESFENKSEAAVDWSKEIKKQKGANRTKLSSLEHNWNIKSSHSYKVGDVAANLVKRQFSLEASYGGNSVDTTSQNWDDARPVREKTSLSVPSGQHVCFWQYTLGLGEEDILYCPEMKMTYSKDPPSEAPLPKSA